MATAPLMPKATAVWLLDNYREAYKLFACNGILFNHESQLRPERFVTQKIVSAARRIADLEDDLAAERALTARLHERLAGQDQQDES